MRQALETVSSLLRYLANRDIIMALHCYKRLGEDLTKLELEDKADQEWLKKKTEEVLNG